jgi:hypothetical protein
MLVFVNCLNMISISEISPHARFRKNEIMFSWIDKFLSFKHLYTKRSDPASTTATLKQAREQEESST